jgi:uncharacterized protein (UPF0335 family)
MFTCQDCGCCNYADNELKILNKEFMDRVEQLEERNTKHSIKIRMLEEMGKGYDKAILNLKKAVKELKKNESKD